MCIVIESKEYLEKYAETLYAVQSETTKENEENNLSMDLSNFSIGSEFININSSSSMLQTSVQDVSVEMEEFVNINSSSMLQMSGQDVSVEIEKFENINSSSFLILQTSIQDAVAMEDEENIGDNKLSESPTGFSDNSIDDPMYQPDEEKECSSEHSDVADESSSLNSKNNISNNLLERSIDTTINTCDDKNLLVSVSKASGGGEKLNVCMFCYKKQTKLARHLETVHKNEDEVKKFKNLPKGCKERTDIIGLLRKKGNFKYNTSACLNDGNLIVSRRPNAKKLRKATDFLPCVKCKAFFSKNSLRVHFKACTGISSARNRCVIVTGKKIAARLHCTANKMVREKLFPPLRDDDIVDLIKYDELVIVYANKMCEKYRNERYCEMIRQRMRLIGRFLKALKEINKDIQNLTDVFEPKYCQDTIRVINKLAGANDDTGHFQNPTVASSLGTILKYISKILINQCIIKHDDEKRKNTKNFLLLFTQEIEINVTRTVTESQVHMRRQKTVDLPLTSDIRKFYMYLQKNLEITYNKLKQKFDISTWLNLSEYTLLSIQVFNRRRPGELERILIEDFKKYEGINDVQKDTLLSEETQKMVERYVRFLIRGKLNRTVPVILDKKQVQCIELLLKYRSQAKIDQKNQYVFAVPGVKNAKYLRACNIIRKHAVLCGAEHPERLRGTKLRKHIATTCIKLNLEEDEVTDLANFMGHDEKIHRNIYRQPVASRDILRVSRLLEVAQGRNEEDKENSSDESSEGEEPVKTPRKKRSTSPYGFVNRRRWTPDETATALNEFEKNLKNKKLPSFKEIQEIKSKCPILSRRSSPQIKTWLHNQFKKRGGK